MRRFAAKLLFQFRPARRSGRSDMALCEERIVTFGAASSGAALAKAKQIARRASYSYRAVGGGRVKFEPVGIIELMELGVETGRGEVWWDLYRRRSRRSVAHVSFHQSVASASSLISPPITL